MRTRYMEVNVLTDELTDTLDELDSEAREEFHSRFDYSWIHHENALEGIVLTFEEIHGAATQSVITDLANVTLFKRIRAHFDSLEIGRSEAKAKRFKPNIPLFQKLYETLYMGKDRDKGSYRRDIPLHRTYFHQILEPSKISGELKTLVADTDLADFRSLHAIKQAATFGHSFMRIFPWSEASGKVGRLISNVLLMRGGYFPVIIHEQDRERYYTALKVATPNNLRDLIVESMQNSLSNSVRALQAELESRRGRAG